MRKGTRGTQQVNLDLPVQLVKAVKRFADRDLRNIRVEYILALEMLLAMRDQPPNSEDRDLAQLDDAVLQRLALQLLKKGERELLLVALMARQGWARKKMAIILDLNEVQMGVKLDLIRQALADLNRDESGGSHHEEALQQRAARDRPMGGSILEGVPTGRARRP